MLSGTQGVFGIVYHSECDKTPQCNQEQDSGAVAKVIRTLISRMHNFNHPNFYSNVEQELFKTYIHTQGAGRCKLKKEGSYAGETSHVKISGVLFVPLRGYKRGFSLVPVPRGRFCGTLYGIEPKNYDRR